MSDIHLLDASVVSLIAAGEVVERPASVVKELVENAIDAGSSRIGVEISGGGLKIIRVIDNGCGMSPENAEKAFLKHATSKISTKEDLFRIETMGFRGEALAAISAVSKVELITKPVGQVSGRMLHLEGGTILSSEEIGCADGTVFTVRDLFFNTPARLKFMKCETTEAGVIQSMVERLALSHPEISFRFSVNGTERLQTPGQDNLMDTVWAVFGREFSEMLLPVNYETEVGRVFGYLGKPVYTKPNRNRQVFFLNRRYVRSKLLSTAFESAYKNSMLVGRAPVCVLFLEMPVNRADINVHPGKLEVKFADETAVSGLIRCAAEEALRADNGVVQMHFPKALVRPVPVPVAIPPSDAVSEKISFPSEPKAQTPVSKREKIVFSDVLPASQTQKKSVSVSTESISVVNAPSKSLTSDWTITPPEEPPAQVLSDAFVPVEEPPVSAPVLFETPVYFRILGEAFRCYIIVEKEDEILFVDKHALHERMNFEKLRGSPVSSQSLLQPILCRADAGQNQLLGEHLDLLNSLGFVLEPFGDGDLLVREIPELISLEDALPFLEELADRIATEPGDKLMDRLFYELACKASIRQGSESPAEELYDLIETYFRRKDTLKYCPHGRPIVFSLSRREIEKQFRRVK